MRDVTKRTIQVGITFGAIIGLIGCNEHANDEFSMSQSAVQSENGLTMNGLTMNGLTMNGLTMNGLTMNGLTMNGLTMNGLTMNGLTMNGLTMNGLATADGLSSTQGLMTTAGGRDIVKYMVKCAFPTGRTLTKQDQNGVSYDFPGMLGVAPELETGTCDVDCQERVSACMLAHVNNAGVHIALWLDGEGAIGWGQSPDYPYQEGSFFGNLFPSSSWTGYYCLGTGYDMGSVPGRLGTALASTVYVNPYSGDGKTPCAQQCAAHANGDGFDSCNYNGKTWKHVVTAWRNFDAATTYKICNYATNKCLGVAGSSTADGAFIEQRAFNSSSAMQFWILQVATGKYKVVNVNSGKAIDQETTGSKRLLQKPYVAGTTTQQIVIKSLNSTSQIGRYNIVSAASATTGFSVNTGNDGEIVVMSTNIGADMGKWVAVPVAALVNPDIAGTVGSSTDTAASAATTAATTTAATTTAAMTTAATTTTTTTTTTTALFASGTGYRMAPASSGGGVSFDLIGGSTANGTGIQEYTTATGNNNQRMQFIANGSNWKIVMNNSTNKCFDVGTANASLIVINDCNGAASQSWTPTFDAASNSFTVKNVASGRCIDIPNGSLGNGTRPQIYDCQAGNNNQKLLIWAAQ